MDSKVRVFLAKKYNLVVGDTFQLFYKGVIEAPNPYCYSIVALCEKGKSFPRYYEFTPQEEGEHELTISVYNAERKLLGSAKTILKVVNAVKPTKPVNVLCIGDSLTSNGVWVKELQRRIAETGGMPEGHGFTNVKFVGSCTKDDVGFEGYGGWQWNNYSTVIPGAVWVKAPNKKTVEDQHSLWKDENGNVWQIETLQVDYLKLNRFSDENCPKPEGGYLTHYKNAVNTDPIKIYSSSEEKPNPFYDEETKTVDLKSYMKRIGVENIDVVYILLGSNGLMRQIAFENTRHDYSQIVKEEAREVIDLIKRDIPNVKIKILAPQLPSCKGGMGNNYGAELPFADYYDILHYTMELNMAYEELALEDGYKEFLEFVHMTAQFDTEYGYPHTVKPVNCRSTITEWFDTNGYHPTPEGRYQIADAVYRNLVKELGKM